MNYSSPSRMIFNNVKVSYSKQVDALDIFSTQDAILLDVRTIHEFARTKIRDAKHIALEDLPNQLDLIKSWNAPIITYCSDGGKSRIATQTLKSANIPVIDGGKRTELIKLLQKKEAMLN